MVTEMRGTVLNWAKDLIDYGKDARAFKGKIELIAKGRIARFQGEYENM